MLYLVSIKHVSFNVRALGFNDLANKLGNLGAELKNSKSDFSYIKDYNQTGSFTLTFPKKYNREVYKKLAGVVDYYLLNSACILK